jgi:outer membrane protein TolC
VATNHHSFKLAATTLAVVVALGGCAVTPTPLTQDEFRAQVQEVQGKLFAGQDTIAAPLTLADATARAIRFNMDYRIRIMEQAATLGQADLANFDLLPRLTASAGYSTRSNESFGFGFGPDGRISANPTASQERTHHTYSVGFAWNVLDFGLSYVRARQLADQSLISEERRRKALQNLVQDVRQAWWRAEAAQRLLPEVDAMLDEIEQSAARAKLIETRRLLPPLQIVAYRRSLLDLEQQLSLRRQEMAQAEIELAALMNLPTGTKYRLADGKSADYAAPMLSAKVEALEAAALENRPELREEAYKSRLTSLEWKKQVLALLPGLGLDLATNYDSNRFLLNNQWGSAGLNLSFNLLKLVSMPAMNRAQQAQEQTDETRRMATAAAILAQTRLAAVRYDLLAHEFGVWDDAMRDDARIVDYLTAAKQVGLETELEVIRARARALTSRIQRDFVHANLQSAMGRLYNSIGLDSLPREMDGTDSASLVRALDERIQAWEKASFSDRLPQKLASFGVMPVAGITGADGDAFQKAMLRILRLSKIPLAAEGKPEYTLQATVELAPRQDSGRPSRIRLKLVDASGKAVVENEHNAMLVEPIGDAQWQALGEGAGYRMIEPLRKLLRQPAAQKQAAGQAAGQAAEQPKAARAGEQISLRPANKLDDKNPLIAFHE